MPVNTKSETNVTTFVFNSGSNLTPAKPVRVVTIKGEPWFVAKDVCDALGFNLESSNASHFTKHLDASEKQKGNRIPGNRGQAPLLISESGLYKLIMRSDKPEAKQFQNWVTQQVLPSIRKTGAYVVGQAPIETQKDDPFAFVEGQMAAYLEAVERVVRTCGKRERADFLNPLIGLENQPLNLSGGE